MAKILKLAGGATVDFISNTGFYLRAEGYRPVIVSPPGDGSIPPYVRENLPVRIIATDEDDLASILQTLATSAKAASTYDRDDTEDTPVFFHRKLDNETGEVRAYTRAVMYQEQHNWFSPAPGASCASRGTVIVEHHPYFERTAIVSMPASAALSGASVVYDPTSVVDVVGDVGARIEKLRWNTGGNPIDRYWFGLRSTDKHGAVGDFANIWECEDGVAGTDGALATDATASPGGGGNTKVTITPGTATLEKRLTIQLTDVTVNPAQNLGKFLWLLRAQVSAGTWEVNLRFGYAGMTDDQMVEAPIRELTNTSWDFFPMGTASIPLPSNHFAYAGVHDNWEIQVWARRTVPGGTLQLDCLCPIPVDEGYLIVWDSDAAVADRGYERSPKEEEIVYSFSVDPFGIAPFDSSRFYLPLGDCRIIAVYARASESRLTDAITFQNTSTYFPRWLSLRGTE